ncbi:uncharacterized protein sha [Euwallacea similis]|uniref:uncharacterized protein sha n=1 Tax=Euwallacea similis TaxID=1736056 RepID=UPI00344C6AAE
MEIGAFLCLTSCLLTFSVAALPLSITDTLRITRHNSGDIFISTSQDKGKTCSEDTCIGISSGTAQAISRNDLCTCRCHQHLPAFREDLQICVDDIHECALAPFVGGSTSQQIPFVFLPLKGQIIHPSKEIFFNGIQKPVCAVSGAKFLTEDGWSDLRNSNNDVPFRLFRDEGRTFLQWVGEQDLRTKMSGRMVLVQLMCRELEEELSVTQQVFTPCVAFRIVGTPLKIHTNVTEVAFSLETNSSSESTESDSLSVSEYVAIGICSILLGLIYVASIFLYLHLKKRSFPKETGKIVREGGGSLATVEEGIIKNNPLLSLSHHFGAPDNTYSDTNSSDNEITPDLIQNHDSQTTAAIVHAQQRGRYRPTSPQGGDTYQDDSSFERLPEENVSIVETLEDRPDGLKALTGTVRKKLYFNPAYFEHHLLVAPPPAALEFLAKIREVVSIAKQKMANKRYVPTLLNIPEEESAYSIEPSCDFSRPSSRRGSVVSLKRENSRRKSCACCNGCDAQLRTKVPSPSELPMLVACQNCCANLESKQRSIRKWLEDIPLLHNTNDQNNIVPTPKRLRSPCRSLPPESISSERALSPRPASESGGGLPRKGVKKKEKERRVLKPKSPPPPAPQAPKPIVHYDTVPVEVRRDLPPPDMIQEAMEMESQAEEIRIPTLTKKQMNAVINELTVHKNMLEAANRELARRASAGYDTDSLERNIKNKGYSTPSDYADVSSQVSPSLSAALPVDEEITMQNAVFKKENGNVDPEEHEYELVVLKNNKFPCGYSLVSEVYVNNGYNFSSNPSSPSNSNTSTLEKRSLKVRYDGGAEKPGKLLIEVEDCLDHYIPVNDSDEFEPDTLDRPSKLKDVSGNSQILLRTTGSFKSLDMNHLDTRNFNRVFRSLREMYEEKRKLQDPQSLLELDGRLLTLEERHSKRQRVKTTSSGPPVPPDLIPPPPIDDGPVYEHPKPPRIVSQPKNSNGRGVTSGTPKKNRQKWFYTTMRPEDSGYLSTDSSETKLKPAIGDGNGGSETDESLGDAQSESGAESVETHSVFFGRFPRKMYYTSMDSGVINCEDGHSSSDSETVSYTTVVPVSPNNTSLMMR